MPRPSRRAVTLDKAKRNAPAVVAEQRLPLPPNRNPPPSYVFAHYADNGWEYVHGYGFLPVLSRINAKPGCNGVGRDGDMKMTLQGVANKGGTIIDPMDKRLLQEGESPDTAEWYDYVRYYECEDGRRYYVEPGEVPTVMLNGTIQWNTHEAIDISRRFRKHLLDAGIVEPMHPLVYEQLVEEKRARIDSLQGRAARSPHLADRIETALRDLDGMHQTWAAMHPETGADDEPVAHQPRPKRASTAKKEGAAHA